MSGFKNLFWQKNKYIHAQRLNIHTHTQNFNLAYHKCIFHFWFFYSAVVTRQAFAYSFASNPVSLSKSSRIYCHLGTLYLIITWQLLQFPFTFGAIWIMFLLYTIRKQQSWAALSSDPHPPISPGSLSTSAEQGIVISSKHLYLTFIDRMTWRAASKLHCIQISNELSTASKDSGRFCM